jgi:hypothetical protein
MRTSPKLPALLAASLFTAACVDHRGAREPAVVTLGTVAFETLTEIPAGVQRTADVAVADLTGDGVADLAVGDLFGTVRLMVGHGNGGFTEGERYAAAPGASTVLAGDVDGDGDQDLVLASFADDVVCVLVNDGAGGFAGRPKIDVAPLPSAVAIGDCDFDGFLDLVVAHFSRSDVWMFPGHGDGTFGVPKALSMPRGARTAGLSIHDVTGDGLAEILVCDTDNDRVVVLLGDRTAPHTRALLLPTAAAPIGVALGDLTADGLPDIAVSSFGARVVQVFTHVGGTRIEPVQSVSLDGIPANSSIGDVTGDAVPDLVVCLLDSSSVTILPGAAGGGLSGAEIRLGATGFPFRPVIRDLNSDTQPDLLLVATGTDRLNLYLGRAHGLAGARHHRTPLEAPHVVDAADFDGDGRAELVVAGLASPRIAFLASTAAADGSGDPVLAPVAEVELGRLVYNVVARDLDRDGRPDVLVAIEGGVVVLVNRGAFHFEVLPPGAGGVLGAGEGPFEMAAEDLDRDGRLDLVVAYHLSDKVQVMLGQGDGTSFRPAVDTAIEGRPGGLALADFDGDGVIEVATTRIERSSILVMEVLADAALATSVEVPVGQVPTYLRSADFDRDGRADLVVSNGESDAISILISEPAGGFRRLDVPAGRRPTALLTRDLNRDGFVDILVASLTGADFRVVLGDGRGGVQQMLVFPGNYSASSAAMADLNGNDLEDLTVAGLLTRRLAVFKNVSHR